MKCCNITALAGLSSNQSSSDPDISRELLLWIQLLYLPNGNFIFSNKFLRGSLKTRYSEKSNNVRKCFMTFDFRIKALMNIMD